MDCHRCLHNENVVSGFYRDTPFEQTPCFKCTQKVERLNEVRSVVPDYERVDSSSMPEVLNDDDMMPVRILGEFVAGLMLLGAKVRETVCLRYEGLSYPEIGKKLGCTARICQKRVERACASWNELHHLMPIVRGNRAMKRAKAAKTNRLGRSADKIESLNP